MNSVVRRSITLAIEAIGANRCDLFVVKSLLIDLRQESPNGSILREIGDFVAHPAKRDRGLNHQNIKRMASEMKVAFEKGGSFTIAPTFDGTQIIHDLGGVIGQAGFARETREVVENKSQELITCILALLQGARFDGLPVSAEAFVTAENAKLALECKFPSTDLGASAYSRPNVDFALPLIVTAVDAPESVLRPRHNTGRSMPIFEVFRDSGNVLSLRQVT